MKEAENAGTGGSVPVGASGAAMVVNAASAKSRASEIQLGMLQVIKGHNYD